MSQLQDCIDVLTDIIQAQHKNGKEYQPTPTDFFQVITQAISSGSLGEKLFLMLKVYEAVIPEAAPVVVASNFQLVMKTLLSIAQANVGDPNLLSITLTVIGLVLCKQETSEGFWSGMNALQALNGILAFIDDENPKIRKASHEAVIGLLAQHHQQKALPVRSYFTSFAMGVMKACSRNSYKRAHCLVVLLESALVDLPESSLLALLDQMLKLQNCEIPKLTASVYRTLDAFYQNSRYSLSKDFSFSSLALLLDRPPASSDIETVCHFLNASTSALLLCFKLKRSPQDVAAVSEALERLVGGHCGALLSSDFQQIHCALGNNLKRIQTAWLQSADKAATKELAAWFEAAGAEAEFPPAAVSAASLPPAVRAVAALLSCYEQVLAVRHHPCWIFLLEALRSLLDLFHFQFAAAPRSAELIRFFFRRPVDKMAELYSAVVEKNLFPLDVPFVLALQESLVKVFHTLGLVAFLSAVPLFELAEGQFRSREWVAELLAKELRNTRSRITDFVFTLLPIAGKLHKLVVFHRQRLAALPASAPAAQRDGLAVQVRLLSEKIAQVWRLLPEICANQVLDLPASLGKLLPILASTLGDADYPALHGLVVTTLRNLATGLTAQHLYANEAQVRGLFEQHAAEVLMMLLGRLEAFTAFADPAVKETVTTLGLWAAFASDGLLQKISKRLLAVILTATTEATAPQAEEAGAMDQDGNDAAEEEAARRARQESQERAAVWMSALLSLVPLMSSALVGLIFKTIRPLLALGETILLQKRAYGLLHAIIAHHAAVLFQQLGLADEAEAALSLLRFLNESLLAAQVSARNIRLRCIETLLRKVAAAPGPAAARWETLRTAFRTMAGELLVCLRDANKKTRDCALAVLRIFSHGLPRLVFFRELLACSAAGQAATASQRAAVLNAMALHLAEQFSAHMERLADRLDDDDSGDEAENDSEAGEQAADSDEEEEEEEEEEAGAGQMVVTAPLQGESEEEDPADSYEQLVAAAIECLDSLLPLLREEVPEQSKAVLVFLRLVLLMADRDQAAVLLGPVVSAVTRGLGGLKAKFSAKVRGIFRKLLRKVDEAELRAVTPAADIALLDYIGREHRKSLRKKLLKKQLRQQHQAAGLAGADLYERMMAADSDVDEEADAAEMEEEPAAPGRGTTVRGGKTTRGSVVSRKTGRLQTQAGSVRGRGEEDEDEEEAAGGREDYRFQSRKVRGLRAKDFQLDEPVTLADLIDGRRRPRREPPQNGRSLKKRGRETEEAEEEADSDLPDDEDLEAVPEPRRPQQQRKQRGSVDNPFPAHQPHKKQRLGPQAAQTLSAQALPQQTSDPVSSGRPDSRREDDRFQVVLGRDGRLKIQERPLELSAPASSALGQLSQTGRSLAGQSRRAPSLQSNSAPGPQRPQKKKAGLRLKRPGIEYKAKKAGGDVWRKGQVQPHAFIPLDPRLLSRKHTASAVEHFGYVVSHPGGARDGRRKLKIKPRR